MRRKKEDSDKTRLNLLDSALDLFLAQGYQATSLDQIAKRANVTRGAAYWHFPQGKAQLVNSLIEEKSVLLGKRVAKREASLLSPWEKFCAYLLTWCEALENDKEFRKVTQLVVFKLEDVPELQDGMKKKKAAIKQSVTHLSVLLEQARVARYLRADVDCKSIALIAYSQLWGLSELWLMNTRSFSLSKSMQQFVEVLGLGLITGIND